jgi:signal transduction histidine kinase/DNA-binding NarL/FixJ family response regulator
MIRKNGSRLLGLLGIVAGTLTLIALTWIGTLTAIRTERTDAEDRVTADATNQAQIFEEQLQRKLLEVDQTLRILARTWEADPENFDLPAARRQFVALNDLSSQVFIADAHGIVQHDTVPATLGTSVSNRDFFRYEAGQTTDDDAMFISPTTMGSVVREWQLNLARRLHNPDGSFAGVVVASMRISALGSFYQMANIGSHGIIAVVAMERGGVRVAVGPHRIDPGSLIADTDMFKAMQADPDGVWIGRSAFDGIERVHGFRHVADRDLEVVVGIDQAEVMGVTNAWVKAAYGFAGGITALLLAMAGLLLHDLHAARRREHALAHDRAVLAAANTQLELAKASADAKSAQLEATLVGMTDGVAMVDGRMRLVEWNPRYPGLAGVPSGILRVGLPMEDILRAQAEAGEFGDVDIAAEVARQAALLSGGGYPATTEHTKPDGKVIEVRRNRLPDGGFVTLYADITARKQAETTLRQAGAVAEAAARAMSRFVAIVSHEIRTPLNALLSSLTLLADSTLAPTQQALVDMSRQSGNALMALMNDVLEMSKMEAGQLMLRPSSFVLRQLIESAIEMFQAPATERGIALRLSVGPGVPDELHTDPGRLRQVLLNLLSNAVKFAASGEVRVTAEAQLVGGEQKLRLAVRDRGPVIPEDDRGRLFKPFSRIEQPGAEGPLGTGLGLAICQHLITLMDGDIGCNVWTMGGREAGNEFWIMLPVTASPSHADDAAALSGAQRWRFLPRTRVLLVEDIVANQLVTATLLRREGHLVDIACNGLDAISAVAGQPYDLVFMDIFMPGMSGLNAAKLIRGMAGPPATVPIVALTANACPEDQALCAAAGMNGMLGKPVALAELLDALARHVWPHRPDRITLDTPSASTSATRSSILSAARLDELRGALAAETLGSLIEDCLVDLSERLKALQQALRRDAMEQAIADAHAMAGMAAEYGMAALESRVRMLMQLMRAEPASARAIAAELEDEIVRTATAMREALQTEMV